MPQIFLCNLIAVDSIFVAINKKNKFCVVVTAFDLLTLFYKKIL